MLEPAPHPYAIEISPAAKPAGSYTWAIRRNGTLVERSDRTYPSEARAHERALEAIQRDMTPGAQAGPARR